MDTKKKDIKKKNGNKKPLAKTDKNKSNNIIRLNRQFNSKNFIYTLKLRNIFIVIIIIFILLL